MRELVFDSPGKLHWEDVAAPVLESPKKPSFVRSRWPVATWTLRFCEDKRPFEVARSIGFAIDCRKA